MINTTDIIGRGWSFPLRLDPTGSIALVGGQAEIDQAITIILNTSPGERVMRPTFGSRLRELVFAPNTTQTAAQACRYVEDALAMWEPRINVDQVRAWPDSNHPNVLLIEVDYTVKVTHDPRSLVFPFYLIPNEDN